MYAVGYAIPLPTWVMFSLNAMQLGIKRCYKYGLSKNLMLLLLMMMMKLPILPCAEKLES